MRAETKSVWVTIATSDLAQSLAYRKPSKKEERKEGKEKERGELNEEMKKRDNQESDVTKMLT